LKVVGSQAFYCAFSRRKYCGQAVVNAKKLLLLVENNLPNSFMGCQNKVKKPEVLFLHQEFGIYGGAVVVAICTEDQKPQMIFSLTCQNGRQLLTNFKEMVFVLLRLELV
jgi:hypothetical protein